MGREDTKVQDGVEDDFALDADRPIQSAADDRFRRAPFASILARHLSTVPDGQSLVFSLHGPWGAGKTSVLYMVEEHLRKEEIEVIWFNPWLFSGTEQIASQFMRELGLRLGSKESRFGRVGEHIESYGRLLEVGGTLFTLSALAAGLPGWSVIPGFAGAGLSSALGKVFKAVPRESVRETRSRIEKALHDAGRRIVVFVDDIDRLDGDEIRLVFKMVRLVADFPNVSYVLAFDRPRVERALGTEDLTGRAYLAKIVQASFDLPPFDPDILTKMLPQELTRCVGARLHGPFHAHDWQDIFMQVIRPLIRYPRDVRRFLNAIVPAVDMLGEEVALEDVLALEAIRVFLPDVYEALSEYTDVLCMNPLGVTRQHERHQREAAEQRVREFLKLGGDHEGVVRELCRFVFPMSRFAIDNHVYDGSSLRRWRKSRRVAASEVLNVYLERTVRVGAAKAAVVRQLVDAFDDEAAVAKILATLDADELEATLGRLEDHVKTLAGMSFESGLVAVLRNADRLRQGRNQPFDFGSRMVISRLVLWTLRNVDDPERRLEAVKRVVARTESFTWREEVLRVASRSGDDDALLDEADLGELRSALREQVLSSTPERLARERSPELVARMAHDATTKTFDPRFAGFLQNLTFFRAMLASLLSESMSWGFDSVALRKTLRLPWKSLKEVAGGEERLRELFKAAVDAGPALEGEDRLAAALQLVRGVLEGRVKMTDPDVHDPDDDRDAEED